MLVEGCLSPAMASANPLQGASNLSASRSSSNCSTRGVNNCHTIVKRGTVVLAFIEASTVPGFWFPLLNSATSCDKGFRRAPGVVPALCFFELVRRRQTDPKQPWLHSDLQCTGGPIYSCSCRPLKRDPVLLPGSHPLWRS